MASSFQGFSRDLLSFFKALAKNNNKAWFDEHRRDYQGLLIEPAKQFVAAMAPELQRLSKNVRAEPRVNGSIMRINRDTRFSKDKTPYKLNLSMIFPEGSEFDRQHPAFLMQVDATTLCIGAGLCGFSPEQLAGYRKAVVEKKSGQALQAAIHKVKKAGFPNLGGEHYKRVPRGFDPEHPNADLLRHAGLDIGRQEPLPEALFGKDAVAYCMGCFREVRPLQRWLVEALDVL